MVNFQGHIIRDILKICYLVCCRVINRDGFPFLPGNPLFLEFGFKLMGRFVINQPAIDDSFPVAIGVDRFAEDIRRVGGQGWR